MNKALILTGFAVFALNLQAGTIYTNFGPGDTYQAASGAVVVSGGIDQRPSFSFISDIDQLLTQVDFVASVDQSNTSNNSITVTLSSDNGGAPGTVIASQTFTNSLGIRGSVETPPTILSWLPTVAPSLVAQNQYWITFDSPGDPAQGDVFWNFNTEGAFGYSSFSNGQWTSTSNTLGAIRLVSGSPSESGTPEPGTLVLIASGIGAFFGRRRFLFLLA